MHKILKAAKFILLSVVGLIVVAVAAILALRAYRQHVTAQALAIHTPNGIDEGMYIKIGGIEQWIQIRGQDRNNPVLLCLHGGPGGTWTPLTAPWFSGTSVAPARRWRQPARLLLIRCRWTA